MSLKPGTRVANPYPETPAEMVQVGSLRLQMCPAVGAVPGTNFTEEVEPCWLTLANVSVIADFAVLVL